MTRTEAKRLAEARGCHMWWDAKLQLWTITRKDERNWTEGCSARYVGAHNLRDMAPETFEKFDLTGVEVDA